MSERFFPGFNFRKFEPAKPFETATLPYGEKYVPSISVDTVQLAELMDIWGSFKIEEKTQTWSISQVQQEFSKQLRDMDQQIKYPRLTMRKRNIEFVTPDEIGPQTDEERQLLIQRYGVSIIKDGIAGHCKINPDGTYAMWIGFAGEENTTSKDDVIRTMSHEYGHTLGKSLDDPILEELKAYAFANLFMRYFCNVDEYRMYPMDVSTIHDTALFWLEQLLDKGISEEAVLAHLTSKKFSKFTSQDYLR